MLFCSDISRAAVGVLNYMFFVSIIIWYRYITQEREREKKTEDPEGV